MNSPPLTRAHLGALIDLILADTPPHPPKIGVHYPGPWQGEADFQVNDYRIQVSTCPSPLAFRRDLHRHEPDGVIRVLLTPLSEAELGGDVACRLLGMGLNCIHPWINVKTLFKLRDIDDRLTRQTWMVDALLEAPHLKHKLQGRHLNEHLVWTVLRESYRGFQDQPDLIMLTAWCADPEKRADFARTPDAFRQWLPGYLRDHVSATAALMIELVNDGRGDRILPMGLLAPILWDRDCPDHDQAAVAVARARLEEREHLGVLNAARAADWAAAAESVISSALHGASLDGKIPQQVWAHCDLAQQMLRDIGLGDHAWKSPFLAEGFEQRLEQLAAAVETVLAPRYSGDTAAVEAALERVRSHRRARLNTHRVAGAAMAVRLLRRLRQGEQPVADLKAAMLDYQQDGGFVDWARRELYKGDPNGTLERVYKKLISAATQIRERQNQRFGELVRDWTRTGRKGNDTFYLMEEVLDRVVVPLAELGPVLLLVMDGMSMETYRELQDHLLGLGWKEMGHDGAARSILPPFPSCTHTSRTTLFSGKPAVGKAADESKAFRAHPGLAALCRRKGSEPYLWHKEPLADPGGGALAGDVRRIIQDEAHPVVAMVVNTIDANLATGEQAREHWRPARLHQVQAALHEAHRMGRTLILTADHGHILQWDTAYRKEDGAGERWRPASGEPTAGELLFSGPRVLTPDQTAILPWTEKLRYAPQKYGYHGGASPQEAVVPLGIFVDVRREMPNKWREVGAAQPDWWFAGQAVLPTAPAAVAAKAPAVNQADLFHTPKTLAEALFASTDFQECLARNRGRRNPISDTDIHKFITAFETHNFRLTHEALANRMDKQRFRIAGLFSKMNRLLNLDGYAVLSDQDGYYLLDETMLKTQFRLE